MLSSKKYFNAIALNLFTEKQFFFVTDFARLKSQGERNFFREINTPFVANSSFLQLYHHLCLFYKYPILSVCKIKK